MLNADPNQLQIRADWIALVVGGLGGGFKDLHWSL